MSTGGEETRHAHPLFRRQAHLASKVVQVLHNLLKDELLPAMIEEAMTSGSNQRRCRNSARKQNAPRVLAKAVDSDDVLRDVLG